MEISQRAQKRDVTQIDPVIEEAFARMEKAAKNTGSISGIPSGFHALDKITSGWQTPDDPMRQRALQAFRIF
jgi:replicative DNA helicase